MPRPLVPLARWLGGRLARRFVAAYQSASAVTVDMASVRWHQAAVCLRALSEVAGWVRDGIADERPGHPWLISAPAFAGPRYLGHRRGGAAAVTAPRVASRDERGALAFFGDRYAIAASDAGRQVEERVIGASWGVNGYTTLEQADLLARLLALETGRRVLDIGTGRGWPGVYYALRYRCDVVATDMPRQGLALATTRADREGVAHRLHAVAAAGGRQPFRAESFDAVVHTDVLC